MDTMVSDRVGMSEAEWQARCDLAALYRITDLFGWTDTIDTHMTVRIPGEPELLPDQQLRRPVRRDHRLEPGEAGHRRQGLRHATAASTPPASPSIAASTRRRPDANCVMHTHTRAGTGVSVLKKGLRPISQDVLAVCDDLVYHEYGMPTSDDECEALGITCQGGNSVVLRNHGLLTVGAVDPGRAAPHVHAGARLRGRSHRARNRTRSRRRSSRTSSASTASAPRQQRAHPEYGIAYWNAALRQIEGVGTDWRQ